MPPLDTIRAQFPSLASPTVYLDNAGSSQVPRCVADAVHHYFLASYAQTGGSYTESLSAADTVHDAHELMARCANLPSWQHAILGASDSALVRMLADAFADSASHSSPAAATRNQIIVNLNGHESNIGCWLRLAKLGFAITPWHDLPVAGDAFVSSLKPLLSARTRLVVFPHVSNILGSVVNVRAIADLAHNAGARILVDGVAFAPHRTIDLPALGADWYSWSTYKVLGPHAAVLAGTPDAMAEVTGPNHFFMPADAWPKKFELGGISHEACAALLGIQPYLRLLAGEATPASNELISRSTIERAFGIMAALELPLQHRLITGLQSIRGITIHGPTATDASRVPTVAFTLAGRTSEQVATAANARGLALRFGHFYSHRLVSTLLPGHDPDDGVIRISLVHYNTPAEVDAALAFIAEQAAQ